MIYFTIPLQSRQVASDWGRVCQLLENTLQSCSNQTIQEFRILVACHEVPHLSLSNTPSLTFLTVSHPAPSPQSLLEMRIDKQLKRRVLAVQVKSLGGGFIMHVDADDFVHRDMAAFISNNRDSNGFVLKTGYELDYGIVRMFPIENFDQRCGTCAVIKFAPDELPEAIEGNDYSRFSRYVAHHSWELVAALENRKLKPLPFRGAVKAVNHGENLSRHYLKHGLQYAIRRRFSGFRIRQEDVDTFGMPNEFLEH